MLRPVLVRPAHFMPAIGGGAGRAMRCAHPTPAPPRRWPAWPGLGLLVDLHLPSGECMGDSCHAWVITISPSLPVCKNFAHSIYFLSFWFRPPSRSRAERGTRHFFERLPILTHLTSCLSSVPSRCDFLGSERRKKY